MSAKRYFLSSNSKLNHKGALFHCRGENETKKIQTIYCFGFLKEAFHLSQKNRDIFFSVATQLNIISTIPNTFRKYNEAENKVLMKKKHQILPHSHLFNRISSSETQYPLRGIKRICRHSQIPIRSQTSFFQSKSLTLFKLIDFTVNKRSV